ncbi:hypothetical protein LBMAG49_03010 [Planctomycetota bacterium]|nr:hypothetical protein LBMAG49_03010 [Planctomycetota bacterium]
MRSGCLIISFVWLLSCSAGPVSKERAALEQQRLLGPYLTGDEVGCGSLQIELTRNFYANVAQPALDDKVHGVRKEKGDGYEDTIWINKVGDLRFAFTVTICDADPLADPAVVRPMTKFTVVNELRVRVFGDGHALSLDAIATGKPLVLVQKGKAKPIDLVQFEIRDGQRRAQ